MSRPGSRLTTLRHFADCRPDETNAVGLELRDVAARRRIEPHGRIHGRRDKHRLVGREQNSGRKIVGVTAGHPRDEVGGRWSDDDEVVIACETDMPDLALLIEIEEIGQHTLIGQRGRRKAA